jgi:hypothetical protein
MVSLTPPPIVIRGNSPGTNWLGDLQNRSRQSGQCDMRKLLTVPGLELRPLHPQALQSIVSRYTDCATPIQCKLYRIYYIEQVEEDEMGRLCSTNGEEEERIYIIGGRARGKEPLG